MPSCSAAYGRLFVDSAVKCRKPLFFGERTVKYDAWSPYPAYKMLQSLGGKSDLRHKIKYLFSFFYHIPAEFGEYLAFSAPGHSVKQDRLAIAFIPAFDDRSRNLFLSRIERCLGKFFSFGVGAQV